MSDEKFTPGPWELPTGYETIADDEESPLIPIFTNGDPFTVHAFVVAGRNAKANAGLITAATDIYEALELAHVFLDSLPKGWLGKTTGDVGALNDFYLKSKVAMAKVKGK